MAHTMHDKKSPRYYLRYVEAVFVCVGVYATAMDDSVTHPILLR